MDDGELIGINDRACFLALFLCLVYSLELKSQLQNWAEGVRERETGKVRINVALLCGVFGQKGQKRWMDSAQCLYLIACGREGGVRMCDFDSNETVVLR